MKVSTETGEGMDTVGTFLFETLGIIRTFYQRLVAKGKTKMTALVAAMRKILTIHRFMIAKNEYWSPNDT